MSKAPTKKTMLELMKVADIEPHFIENGTLSDENYQHVLDLKEVIHDNDLVKFVIFLVKKANYNITPF